MVWNPTQYEQFRDARSAPFADLVAMARWRPGLRIVDLGCGTGELTARLADLSPGADIVGVDSSPEMLARARGRTRPGLRFVRSTIEDWAMGGVDSNPGPTAQTMMQASAGQPDVIFSHAALHWVDDHRQLFARLAGRLTDGRGGPPQGQLVVQMPSNHGHASHQIVRDVAAEAPFSAALGGCVRPTPVLSIGEYAELLHALGFSQITVLEKVYGQQMQDGAAVLDWVRGTLLVPYEQRLRDDPGRWGAFLSRVRQRYEEELQGRPYFYAFRRTLLVAQGHTE